MQLAPRKVITWDKVQRIYRNVEIWKQTDSVVHRLPEHYKRRYWQNQLCDRRPVHYEPPKTRYGWDSIRNERVEYEHYPIIPIHPLEADQGLWGGEGVLKGYYLGEPDKRSRYRPRNWTPFFKFPQLFRRVYYSEILDGYMLMWTTITAHRLIDQNQGLDYYLLKTSEIDLDSKLGNKLKRELYLSLARGADCHKDENKKKYILEKYSEFIMPEEEAEWIALDLNEACRKQQDMEQARLSDTTLPLKVQYEKELIEKLKNTNMANLEDESGTVSKLWKRVTFRSGNKPKTS